MAPMKGCRIQSISVRGGVGGDEILSGAVHHNQYRFPRRSYWILSYSENDDKSKSSHDPNSKFSQIVFCQIVFCHIASPKLKIAKEQTKPTQAAAEFMRKISFFARIFDAVVSQKRSGCATATYLERRWSCGSSVVRSVDWSVLLKPRSNNRQTGRQTDDN